MAIWAFHSFRSEPVFRSAVASLGFLIAEALLGAGLALFRYTGTNATAGRAIYLAAHLANTLALLNLTAWWASGHRRIQWSQPQARLRGCAITAAVLIAVTGALTALSDTPFAILHSPQESPPICHRRRPRSFVSGSCTPP